MLLTVHHSVKYDVISHLPLHLAWDLNHVFVQYIHTVYATNLSVSQ
jgi:hypothetical protein